MSTPPEPDELQIPLLTDIVEGGDESEFDEDEMDITQPHSAPAPISRMEINFIVQSTLAKYLVLAGKEISERLHRQIKNSTNEDD